MGRQTSASSLNIWWSSRNGRLMGTWHRRQEAGGRRAGVQEAARSGAGQEAGQGKGAGGYISSGQGEEGSLVSSPAR